MIYRRPIRDVVEERHGRWVCERDFTCWCLLAPHLDGHAPVASRCCRQVFLIVINDVSYPRCHWCCHLVAVSIYRTQSHGGGNIFCLQSSTWFDTEKKTGLVLIYEVSECSYCFCCCSHIIYTTQQQCYRCCVYWSCFCSLFARVFGDAVCDVEGLEVKQAYCCSTSERGVVVNAMQPPFTSYCTSRMYVYNTHTHIQRPAQRVGGWD